MSDFDAPSVAARLLEPEELTAADLAAYQLHTVAHHRELWRDVTRTKGDLERAIVAARDAGHVPSRPGPGFRTWDLHGVLGRMGANTIAVLASNRGELRVRPRALDVPAELSQLGDDWWTPVESTRMARRRCFEIRALAPGVPGVVGRSRLSVGERKALDGALTRSWQDLARSMPDAESWWLRRLRVHACLVLRLRKAGGDGPARLCEAQLAGGIALAQQRLDVGYRELRQRVGKLNDDLIRPALTAASFSHEQRARDSALDLLVEHAPEARQLLGDADALDERTCERFLDLLDEVGLQGWYSELTTVGWGDHFVDMSDDQRRAVVHGRVRSLAALTEELLPVLASHAAGPNAGREVTEQATMHPRIEKLLSILGPTVPHWEPASFQAIRTSVRPPFAEPALRNAFVALGIRGRDDVSPPDSPEALLAALVLVRNLAAHRFPSRADSSAQAWRRVFGDVLPGVNRRMVVAALSLWGLADAARTRRIGAEEGPGPGTMEPDAPSPTETPAC